ncbi:MAG TPA: hypothetical protein H9862_08580 [Candidatus Akkermansia intestinigallinarum]|uniref:Uncharacterized protein n=1 Tax=Candidatus Akkermansia intestinigallinarum TaxID=2838431 RepID=A0A9D1VCN5_9BACT|nr:hypothetical protein [Candidatus Akkermansia intestinigallinarum]
MKKRLSLIRVGALAVLTAAPVGFAQQDVDPDEVLTDTLEDVSPDLTEQDEERLPGEVPAMFRDDAMLDESHSNQELGINVYTAPSISKIFAQLDHLPSIPEDYVLRKRPEKLSTDAGSLALEMGFLLADGFIAVRSGHMNDIKPIALDLSRYGKAMGVGEKMNVHSASLLENAEKGNLEKFKEILSATQNDVNAELMDLRDPDLAHLIALGGWVRALEASTAAIDARFDAEQAAVIFYPDAPEYFSEILEGLSPVTAQKLKVAQMREQLALLAEQMRLKPGESPTPERIKAINETAARLATLSVGPGYEH